MERGHHIIHYIKIILMLLLLSLLVSCKTTHTAQQEPMINRINTILNNSMNNSNMYIGISPRMRTREKEVYNAKLHIAHQIAIRYNCIVDVGGLHISEGKNDFYLFDYGFDYNDTHIDEIMDCIEVINIYEFQELVIIIGKDSSKPAEINIRISENTAERPQWVNNLRWIRELLGQEYYVGIGIADKYRMFYKGIYMADIGAAQAIASEEETFINTYTQDLAEIKTEHYASGTLAMTENIELEGFYILCRWIEPSGEKFYSLGIANKRILK